MEPLRRGILSAGQQCGSKHVRIVQCAGNVRYLPLARTANHFAIADADGRVRILFTIGCHVRRSTATYRYQYSVDRQLFVEAEQARREVWRGVSPHQHSAEI